MRDTPRGERRSSADLVLTIVAPDKRRSRLIVEAKTALTPRGAVELAIPRNTDKGPKRPTLIVSGYLTPSARERLREGRIGFLDLTGNAWLSLREPGLFIETQGALTNPDRPGRPARSIKGPKAGRAVRALCDFREPVGVRQLASRSGLDPGYVSRLLTLLAGEALIERASSGKVFKVDWARLLRRWAEDSPVEARASTATYIEPRGLDALLAALAASDMRYAVTGSLAAARVVPTAPTRLATVYVEALDKAADRLRLRETKSGMNVVLAAPADDVVFERIRKRDGTTYAAPSQVAADLMSGPGRSPAEAEELLAWMAAHEDQWRG